MSLRYHYETPDPNDAGKILDVFVDVDPAVETADDPAERQRFYDAHRAQYPEASLELRLQAGRITQAQYAALKAAQGAK